MREQILHYGLYLAGIIALGAFVIAKNESLMDQATQQAYRNGDLYRLVDDLQILEGPRLVSDDSVERERLRPGVERRA